MPRLLAARVACVLFPALAAAPAGGQEAGQRAYTVDRWNTDAGLPQNSVNAILQSRDGHLWLGTLGGIARFDGTVFTTFTTGDRTGLRSDRTRALAEDRDGRIWIATEQGLSRWDRGTITTFTRRDGLPDDVLDGVAAHPDGSVWFATRQGALGHVDGAGIHVLVPKFGAFGDLVADLKVGRSGTVWVSAQTGIWRLDPGSWRPVLAWPPRPRPGRPYTPLAADSASGVWLVGDSGVVHLERGGGHQYSLIGGPGLDVARIRALAAGGAGVLWIGMGTGDVWRLDTGSEGDGRLTRVRDPEPGIVTTMAVDREGSLWIGDRISGLARVRPSLFHTYVRGDSGASDFENGKAGDNLIAVFADSRQRVWTAAKCAGVAMVVGGGERRVALPKSRSPNCAWTIAEDTSGAIWIGGDGPRPLGSWRDGAFTPLGPGVVSQLPDRRVRALLRDRRGTLWIGTRGGLASWDGRVLRLHAGRAGGRPPDVQSITEARDGTLWLATMHGLWHYVDGDFRVLTTADGLPHDDVRAIAEDSTGTLWLATYGGGAARVRGGSVRSFTTANGLYDNFLSSVADDGAGNLWFSGNRGVFRVARRELEAFADGRLGSRARLHSVAYGRADGMLSSETNGGAQPSVARTADGRLWYPTLIGVTVIDPATATSVIPPTVAIERLAVNGEPRDPWGALSLGPGSADVDIAYAGLSLNAPNAVSFRYRLEGWDRDWVDAGTRRSARYSRLAPGQYRFRVMAANRDGIWSGAAATLAFTVRPHVWQTWWFRALALLAVVAAAVAAHRARVRRLRATTELAEREVARRRIEQILQSITDGFVALDAEWRFTFVNHTAEQLLGQPRAALVGRSFWESFPGAVGSLTETSLRRVAAERTSVVFEAPDAPRRGRWLEVHAYPADDGVSVYFSDVTGRKEAEVALRRQNEVLAENVRLKDEVERISRHDLRTPLTSIISLAQIVREDQALPPRHVASLRLIEQAGYRVMNMASLTLDLFRMEQGTYQLAPRAVDVRAVVERVLLDLQALIRTREVTCEIVERGGEAGRGAPPLALGDELLSYSMLSNLVKNAVEASPPGARVTIGIAAAGEETLIRVHNVGAIAEAVRGRFFEKYASAGKRGGTGLGAYSARLMAQTQGGRIEVETSEERGTTIVVALPAASGAGRPTPAPADAMRAVAPGGERAHERRRVLVVDDEPTNRRILRHFLAHPAWTVDEAENGPLAVRKLTDHRYDVVFMDVEMPVMDGFEAVERMRAVEAARGDGHRALIAALSSHDDERTRDRAFGAGCDRYLAKPVHRDAVVELVVGGAAAPAAAVVVTLDADLRPLVPSFLERKRTEIAFVREALAREDVEGVRHASHRMRGSFSMYGFADAAALCAELETLAAANRLRLAAERLPALDDYLDRVDVRYTNG